MLNPLERLDPVRRNVYLLLTAFWVAALGVALAGYVYYLKGKAAVENEVRTQLSAIAELKVRHIREWREERLDNGRFLGLTPVPPAVAKYLSKGVAGSPPAEVLKWLKTIRETLEYGNVILVNPARRIWTADGKSSNTPEFYFALARQAMEADGPILTDFHRDDGPLGVHLGLNVALRDRAGGEPVGALLIGIDPKESLYPAIQEWPTGSRSAESMLVRREGNEVVFLNNVRHQRDTALRMRLPLSNSKLPAAQGALGFEGITTGVDYRGVPVLAALRQVPGAPWVLVTKIDLAEIHSATERQTFWLGLVACSVILTIGTGIALLLRDLRARFDLQRYTAELEQRALRGHFDYLSRFANDIILLTDENGIIVEANDRAASSYGRSREELIGTQLRHLRAPEAASSFDQDWKNTELQGSVIFETRHVRRDGSTFPVEVSARGVVVDQSLYRQSIIRDITDRKEAEQERARLEEKLQRAQRLESIGRLAGGVAHDFNNLLTVINGYTSMVMDGLPASDENQEMLQEVSAAGHRAASLTRQLLAFSRKQVIAPKVLDLNTVITDVVKLLNRLVGEDIKIVTKLEVSLDPVNVDPGQIEQVLMNLATNARDAMPRGGELIFETRNVEIDGQYASQHVDAQVGKHVLLAVVDNGEGMTEEVLAHAFEPFFTTKPRGQGTGLGLATAYGTIRQSNGWIEVQSQPGKGTRFNIYLPRAATKMRGEADHADGDSAARDFRGNETILIVEDQPEVRNLAAQALRRYGYDLLEASNGEEAIALCESRTGTIDLLVTDVIMPGMTGPELVKRVAPMMPETKILYISGYTETLMGDNNAVDGQTAFLQKPFTARALAEKVRDVLDARHR
jgi:two-component system cell cycle sensor histidine kinase/response regulator CckA